MFLSRLTLNPRSRPARRDLADRYAMHRTLMSAFPDVAGGRDALGVLFRVEADGPAPSVYVQSAAPPDWSGLDQDYLLVDFLEGPPVAKPLAGAWASLDAGRSLRFRLQANPRKQLFLRGGRGKKVPLRRPDDVLAWLDRRAERAGFSLPRSDHGAPRVALRPLDDIVGWQPRATGKRRRITLGAVQLDGRLQVTDAERFRDALRQGVGSGRAFGLGLLSVAP